LVPERRQELTTEGGLKVRGNPRGVRDAVRRLQSRGIPVSLFIDPGAAEVKASRALGAAMVELHTGTYSRAYGPHGPGGRSLERLSEACRLGLDLGLGVHAGHGLTYRNVGPVAAIPGMGDLNIGHNVVARAALVGMERAVREMLELVRAAGGARTVNR
jgi:pyridoxine 5-phosphate synthase